MSLREPMQVARRVIVMTTLAFRGSLETVRQVNAVELSVQLLPWLRQIGLDDELDPIERRILETSLGKLSPSEQADLRAAGEPIAWFAWALNRGERPQPWQWSDPMPWVEKLAMRREQALSLLESPQFREPGKIEAIARETTAMLVALRISRLNERPPGLLVAAKDLIARQKRDQWTALGVPFSDDDLAHATKAVDALPEEQRRHVTGLIMVRELAFSWLFDRRPSYFATESSDQPNP